MSTSENVPEYIYKELLSLYVYLQSIKDQGKFSQTVALISAMSIHPLKMAFITKKVNTLQWSYAVEWCLKPACLQTVYVQFLCVDINTLTPASHMLDIKANVICKQVLQVSVDALNLNFLRFFFELVLENCFRVLMVYVNYNENWAK